MYMDSAASTFQAKLDKSKLCLASAKVKLVASWQSRLRNGSFPREARLLLEPWLSSFALTKLFLPHLPYLEKKKWLHWLEEFFAQQGSFLKAGKLRDCPIKLSRLGILPAVIGIAALQSLPLFVSEINK